MTPDQLAALHEKCFETPRPWRAGEFADLLKSPQVFLIAQANGFALGRVAGPEVELLTLAVDPSVRRRGIGWALLTEIEKTARQNHAKQIFLEVSENNGAAITLYHKAGYRKAGLRKDYYKGLSGQNVDALVLSRDLT